MRLRIVTDRPAEQVLADLSASVLNDYTLLPLRPIKAQGRLLGHVNGDTFSFARLKWFGGGVNPRCTGRVFVENGATVIEAAIRAWWVLITPVLFLAFMAFVMHGAGGSLLVPSVMVLGVTAYLIGAFWVGVERLKSFFRALGSRGMSGV